MKKLFCIMLCLIFFALCACNVVSKESDPYSHVIKAYQEFQKKYNYYSGMKEEQLKKELARNYEMLPQYGFENLREWISEGNKVYYNAFYNIDNNGNKALLLGEDSYLFDVYIIQNGIAVQQQLPNHSVLLKNGTICSYDDDKQACYYYQFEEGKLKFQIELISRYERGNLRTYADEISITKEEYEHLKKKFEGDGKFAALDWCPLAEYGR